MSKKPATLPNPTDPDETVDLERLIDEVVPDPGAWKHAPNPVLGLQAPVDLLRTEEGRRQLRDLLRAAQSGAFS